MSADKKMEKMGRNDLHRIGLFSETGYISTGETYNKKSDLFLGQRTQGRQFTTSKQAVDGSFHRLFENEPYTDIVVLRRRWRLEAKLKNITTSPFKPSSVPPKPSGRGSVWGTIEQQYPTLTKGPLKLPPVKEESLKSSRDPPKPNITTRPPKKGSGYGFPNVTIGKTYEYVSDPFDRAETLARVDREKNKKRNITTTPFVTSCAHSESFSKFICLRDEGAEGKGDGENVTAKASQSDKALLPFRPTSTIGFTINPYPSYEPPKFAKVEPTKDQGVNHDEAIFKPPGKSGSYPVRSITEATCPKVPPPWLQETLRNAFLEAP